MKIFNSIITVLFCTLFLIACSSDDDNANDDADNTPTNYTGDYYPSTTNNSWIYNVENTNPDDSTQDYTGTDIVTVNTETSTGFTLDVNNGAPAFGTMNRFLTNGTLSKTDDTMLFTGSVDAADVFSDFVDTSVAIENFVLYSLNAANDAVLSSSSGVINETIDIDADTTLPLAINYTLSSTKLNTNSSLTVDGETFTDVIKSRLTLKLNINTSIDIAGIATPVSILDDQDVLVIDYYFAKDIGLIKANATQSYSLNQTFIAIFSQIGSLPIPTSATVTNNQDIDNYSLN